MTERARREYAEVLRRRCVVADECERGRILDEYCRTTRCHRKAAIRRLGQRPRPAGRPPGRPRRYGRELLPALERVWRACDYLSGTLLVAILPRLLAARAQHHGVVVTPLLRVALTTASPATLNRLLRPLRQRLPEAAWSRAGRHTESGPYAAEGWLRIYAAHLEDHSRQIEANVAAWRAAGSPR